MALTDIAVRNAKVSERPRKLADGGGLHLLLTPAGGKLWRVSYRFVGKQMTVALGSYPDVTLSLGWNGSSESHKKVAEFGA